MSTRDNRSPFAGVARRGYRSFDPQDLAGIGAHLEQNVTKHTPIGPAYTDHAVGPSRQTASAYLLANGNTSAQNAAQTVGAHPPRPAETNKNHTTSSMVEKYSVQRWRAERPYEQPWYLLAHQKIAASGNDRKQDGSRK